MKIKDGFLFFWGNADYMSNWHKASFELHGLTFNCSEQYMMYSKAMLFGDTYHADLIMKTKSQSDQKAYGRKVSNYDDTVWNNARVEIVYEACLAKFEQNPSLKEQLIATGNLHLVEASPYDKIWGIGLDENHPDATHPARWQGMNLLGEVLMEVRATLSKPKTIKVLKVITVEEEISVLDFINSRSVYFEYFDKDTDDIYIPFPEYPDESFIMIYQELDSGEISYHEIGYVLCPNKPDEFMDAKDYVLEHINEFVALEL